MGSRCLDILSKYREVLASHRLDIGCFRRNLYLHEAYALSTLPSSKRFSPFPVSGQNRENLRRTLESMEQAGVLERDQPSAYSLPVFIIQKKDSQQDSFFKTNTAKKASVNTMTSDGCCTEKKTKNEKEKTGDGCTEEKIIKNG